MAKTKNKKTLRFEFVEETQITKKGKETFWFTNKIEDGFSQLVGDSLSYTREEAERMFDLIVENDGNMKTTMVLKYVETTKV